jgi:hypothetical protein
MKVCDGVEQGAEAAKVREFYDALFAPLIEAEGSLDRDTIMAIVGFEAGGPISLCTIGSERPGPTIFVTCELAVRRDQVPSEVGRYELLTVTSDEAWARSILTNIGGMTLEVAFGHLHTLDIAPWVQEDFHIQGILFTVEYAVVVEGEKYAVIRCSGLTRSQLERAIDGAAEAVADEIGVFRAR